MENEKRLIDANVLATRYRAVDYDSKDTPWTLRDILFFLEKAPTVDAVEVVHGEWQLHGDDDELSCSYFCSQCGYNMDEAEFLDNFSHFRYCPNCGAKMDGGADNV